MKKQVRQMIVVVLFAVVAFTLFASTWIVPDACRWDLLRLTLVTLATICLVCAAGRLSSLMPGPVVTVGKECGTKIVDAHTVWTVFCNSDGEPIRIEEFHNVK